METVIYNTGNLAKDEIDDCVKKARAVLVNNKNEVLLARYANMYMLPGGSVDTKKESFAQGLERELQEETGLENYEMDPEPFLVIHDYIRNYPKRDDSGTTNRYTETQFFLVRMNETTHLTKKHLTASEQEKGFTTRFVPITLLSTLIQMTPSDNAKNVYFVRELLTVLDHLPETYKKLVK